MTLEIANQLVLTEINSNRLEGPTILGLLPIPEDTQSEIIDAVRDAVLGQYRLLSALLVGPHRAAAVYAIAMARANAGGGGSWQPIESRLGVSITNREEFSSRFSAVCRHLLLDVGEIGDCVHLAPILYQAGILRHWVAPMCDGIRITLSEMPAANPDDEEYLIRFCRRIRINAAQMRLIDCLGNLEHDPTRLGILMIRKLLKSKLQGQEQLLPPHLRAPITEAMAEVSNKRQIYPPYLHFDGIDNILRIILPKQNPELLTQDSAWECNARLFNPYRESQVTLQSVDEEAAMVSLKNLSGHLQAVPFQISTKIGGQSPIRVFNAKNGRDLKTKISHDNAIHLPPGEYELLTDATVPFTGIPVTGSFAVGNKLLHRAHIVIRHNDPSQEFHLGGIEYHLQVKQSPGLFLYGEHSVEDLSQPKKKKIYFGNDLTLMAVTAGVNLQAAQPLLSISAEGTNQMMRVAIETDLAMATPDVVSQEIGQNLDGFIAQLPAGIFKICVNLEIGTVILPCEFWYWKGLTHISETFGFACNQAPGNIARRALEGLGLHAGGLEWDPQHLGIEVRIPVDSPQETFIFRKRGLRLQIQEDSNAEFIPLGETLLISHDDRRDLLIKTSGYERCTIRSGQTVLTTLEGNKRDCSIRLAATPGENRTIIADREDGSTPQTLVTLVRPYEATALTIDKAAPSGESSTYTSVFTVSRGVFSLGVSIADLLAQQFPSVEQITELLLPGAVGHPATHQISPSITLTAVMQTDGSYQIKVEADLNSLSEQLALMDFYYRRRAGGNWVQMQYAEQVGSSPMRLVITPLHYTLTDPTAWKNLVAHAEHNGITNTQALIQQLGHISEEDLQTFLTILVNLMLYKYPTPVWNSSLSRAGSSWPEQAIRILAQARFSPLDNSTDIWSRSATCETIQRSAARYAPLIAGSLFSSQPSLYAQPPEKFMMDGESFIDRSFHYSGVASLAPSLTSFLSAPDGRQVWEHYVSCFGNVGAVIRNPSLPLQDFDFNRFFEKLKEGLLRNVGCVVNPTQDLLLSPNHFTDATRKMNRRISGFQLVAQYHAGNHPLVHLLQTITGMHQSFENLQGGCRDDLGYPVGFFDGPQWDHVTGVAFQFPEVETHWGNKIIQIVILLTAMSRLTGYGLKSQAWLNPKLNSLLNPQNTISGLEQGIRVIHSLAPEFFAYFHFFWSLTLKQ